MVVLKELFGGRGDVSITLRVPDIAIPGAEYQDGLAQRVEKLDSHVIST
jgi:hypothetical protein